MSNVYDQRGAIDLDGAPAGGGVPPAPMPQGVSTQNTLGPSFDDGGDVDDGTDGAPSRYPTLEKAHSIVDALVKWGERQYQTPLSDDYEQGAADGGAINVAPQQGSQGPSPASMRVLSHADRASPAHVQILERGAPAQHPADKALLAIGRAAQVHPEAGWAVMQHYLANYDHMRNFAKAALQAGHSDKAADAMTQAYNSLPDGSHVQFQPSADGGLIASLGDGAPGAQGQDQDQADDASAASQEQSAARGGVIRGPLDGLDPGDKAPAYDDGTDDVQPKQDDDDQAQQGPASQLLSQLPGAISGAASAVPSKVRDVGSTLSRAGGAISDLVSGAGNALSQVGDPVAQAEQGIPAYKQFRLSPQQAADVASKPAFPALNDGAVKTLADASKSGYSAEDENAAPTDTTGYSAQDENAAAPKPAAPAAQAQQPMTRQDAAKQGWSEAEFQAGHKFSDAEMGEALQGVPRANADYWRQASSTPQTGNTRSGWEGSPNAKFFDHFKRVADSLPPNGQRKLMGVLNMPGADHMNIGQLANTMATVGVHPTDMFNLFRGAGVPEKDAAEVVQPYTDQLGDAKPTAPGRLGSSGNTSNQKSAKEVQYQSTDDVARREADNAAAEDRRHLEVTTPRPQVPRAPQAPQPAPQQPRAPQSPMAQRMRSRRRRRTQ